MPKMLAPLDLDGNGITSVAGPVNPSDAATKSYADSVAGASTFISAPIGNGSATTLTVTHNLGITTPVVQAWDVSGASPVQILADATATDANTVTLTFAPAPAAGSVRAVVMAPGTGTGGGSGGAVESVNGQAGAVVLTAGDVGAAAEAAASECIVYLSAATLASDSSDGLSWGTAKATLAGAISALGGSGGTVHAGPGTFTFSSSVPWPAQTNIIGQGMHSTVLKYTGTTGSALANPSPGTRIIYGGRLQGFSLVGTNAANSTTGIDLESRSAADVRSVLVTDFGTGVSITSATDGYCLYNRFWQVVSTGNTTGWQVGGEGSNSNTFSGCQGSVCTTGVSVVDSNQNQFTGCQFEANTAAGVAITSAGGTGGRSTANAFLACRFEGNGTGWTTDSGSTGNFVGSAYYGDNTTADYTDTSAATTLVNDDTSGITVPAHLWVGGPPPRNTAFTLGKGQVSVTVPGATTPVGFTAYENDGTSNRRIAFWLGGTTDWGVGLAVGGGAAPPFKIYNGSTSFNPITCTLAQTAFGGGVADLVSTQTLASAGAVTINANNGNVQVITLNANATSSSVTNPVTGQELTIQWVQGTGGGFTYAWPSNCVFPGSPPARSTAANAIDSATFVYNGTNWIAKAVAGGSSALASDTDVAVTSPAQYQGLVYNGTKWANAVPLAYEAVHAIGSTGSTATLDATAGAVQTATLGAATAFSFTSVPATGAWSITLVLSQPATGGPWVPAWSGVKWQDGIPPTITAAASATDILVFTTVNGGTAWYGSLAGANFS